MKFSFLLPPIKKTSVTIKRQDRVEAISKLSTEKRASMVEYYFHIFVFVKKIVNEKYQTTDKYL